MAQRADLAQALNAGEVAVVLPSTDPAPLPSPGLAGASQVTAAPTGVESWRCDCLVAPPAVALDLLLALPSDAGPHAGATLRWLAQAARVGVDLVARGRVLPGLVTVGEQHEARWLPVLTADDRERAAALAAAMPPAARAEHALAPVACGALVRDLVSALVDAAAREAVRAAGGIGVRKARRAHLPPVL